MSSRARKHVFEQIELGLQADNDSQWGIEKHKSLRRTNNPLRWK